MYRFFRKTGENTETCFYVETSAPLSSSELEILKWLLAETFEPELFKETSFLFPTESQEVVELGPRMSFETAFSTNAVSICHACGLTEVTRLECSRRYLLPQGADKAKFVDDHHDSMTECLYPEPLETFETGISPEEVYSIPLIEQGRQALEQANEEMGLGMDSWDIDYYHGLFKDDRNPTNVEVFQLGTANSEHSRHWLWNAILVIGGHTIPDTLMDITKAPLEANPENSVVAFSDNASAIAGYEVLTIIPLEPGACSAFSEYTVDYDITFTAETHNFPSGVAPVPGAETGAGGRIRDGQGIGRGGLVIAGTLGYCTGGFNFPDYPIPGENPNPVYPDNLAGPIEILIGASNGASDYANKFGEPGIQGFTRTFDMNLPDGERRAWLKPIMFSGGVGQIDHRHIHKEEPKKGMLIVQVGGPAYRIGMGGGPASSMFQGENTAELDFNAVQRGDPEQEQKEYRVVRACVEKGDDNPILNAHDQGAGGPCNVLTELVMPAGGWIEIRDIQVGDLTMSVVEIWGAEYQERMAFLIYPDRIEEFKAICEREKVNCEILGKITGDGRIVVHDRNDDSIPVNLELSKILGKMPQKTFSSDHKPRKLAPFLPHAYTVRECLEQIFHLVSVGSKGFLTRKLDRSVGGLVVQQQCCGPLQLPVSNVAVVAQSHFSLTGAATAIGEQPIKMLIDPAAGARMAIGEALTNMACACISRLPDIRCSVNWMGPAKLDNELALIYDAAIAMRDLMIKLGIAVDGGKDSSSMAARVGDDIVKAPGQLVISAYAPVPDIRKVVTPDLKEPGKSKLMFLDLAPGKNRLGGSALAQSFGEIGDESPDLEDPSLLANTFNAVQELIRQGLILSCHDRSDGGLITTLIEMAMSGYCGIEIYLDDDGTKAIDRLFAEELGLVLEYLPKDEGTILDALKASSVPFTILGKTQKRLQVIISYGEEVVLDTSTLTLLNRWESTSDRLEQEQMNPRLAKRQTSFYGHFGPDYRLSFKPEQTPLEALSRSQSAKPKVAIIREEGSNGDREMASAFMAAGFEPWDVAMTHLLSEDVSLSQFRGAAFVGGFSYADVLGSAKGWAGAIKFNPGLKRMFRDFYERQDTFSLGICNGCQLMALMNWVPLGGIDEKSQPRFIRNKSERFESRWITVRIQKSPSIMLREMADSVLGIWVAHGEGRFYCPDPAVLREARSRNLMPIVYLDNRGQTAEEYPFNPNGSVLGVAGLCSPDGRHLAMMPHPERLFRVWQWPWMSEQWKSDLKASPWLKMFQNAREWCERS